jgi:HlyD family secretion protein
MPVWVQVNRDTRLAGTLVNIRPTVENNVISFDIQLEANNHPALRPNMRTEVFILTDRKAQVVKVPNGPAFQGGMTQEIFVVEGDRAIRRKVVVGLQNVDEVEIESGLQAGEQVIISDMKRFEGVSEIIIK